MGSASLELVIPASTLKASSPPVQSKLYLSNVKILGVYFQFPSGCVYLAEVQLIISEGNNSSQSLVPSMSKGNGNALDYIAFDGATGLFLPINRSVKGNQLLVANGWNEDTANQHWIKILLTLE